MSGRTWMCSSASLLTLPWLSMVRPKRGPDRLISLVTRGGISGLVWLQAGVASANTANGAVRTMRRMRVTSHLHSDDTGRGDLEPCEGPEESLKPQGPKVLRS